MNVDVRCLGPLRSGGNADLQIGQRSDTGERVVVKFLREFQSPYARKAFAREIRILARDFPGMMRILFFNVGGERPYYVMPFLTGGCLTRYAGRLSDEQLLVVGVNVAQSLATLHTNHVAHGDIKPDNILVSDDGKLQIADPLGNGFGCTVFFSQNHGGTPGYWPPEIVGGKPISQSGDIYSYGATLFHVLTGQKPVDGQRFDLALRHFNRAPRIRETIIRCCHSDPEVRPNIQETFRLLNGEPWTQIQKTRREQKALTGVLAIGLLGLIGCALAK